MQDNGTERKTDADDKLKGNNKTAAPLRGNQPYPPFGHLPRLGRQVLAALGNAHFPGFSMPKPHAHRFAIQGAKSYNRYTVW